MKNHIAFKFAAVLLAGLLLMTAIGSGFGILLLSQYDLYNRTVEEGYEETMSQVREGFAQALVFRFASMELGGCSTPLIDDYYGNGALYTSFRWGRYAYSVRNQEGEILAELDRELPDAEHFEIPVENGRFIYLISERNVEETTRDRLQMAEGAKPSETEPPETEPSVTETATAETAAETAAPEETAATEETSAEETSAEQTSAEETSAEETSAEETAAAEEETVEETESSEEAAAAEETEASETTAETTAPEETELPETVPSETELPETIPAETEPAAGQSVLSQAPPAEYRENPYYSRDQYEEAFSYPYYNYESGAMKDATLCYANTSDYTVDLYLASDALYDYQMWDLLRLIGPMRGQLFAILGGSLLLVGILMAYLFCAVGKKPGSSKPEAAGLNRTPLDLYTVVLGCGLLGCVWLAAAGAELFRNTQMIQLAVAGGACFLGCLLLICYSLAWAVQIKLNTYYWLRNTVLYRGFRWLIRGLGWFGKSFWGLCRKLPGVFRWLGRVGNKCLNQLMSLLPAMWQWLLSTGVILLILLLAFLIRSRALLVIGFLGALCLTVYGGYCFGILLRGVKRMRGGELKTKVDNEILVGSMREFAEELNGLADVAGVAADKQLKSERMKTELITNVSHDIKTPLTSIINYVDLLSRPHTEQQQEDYLEVLSRQSQRLKKLIDDLMEMSKASTGNMQTEITEVNATEAINQCLGEFTDKLERAMLTPVFRAGDHEVTMMADGRLVWRVMSNLLGNVVKYALPGTRVYVDLAELEDDVIISVKNVSREELNISSDELMERFVRGDVSRNTEGSGLGLNIAKSLMELQHGQMELLVDGDLFKVTLIFPKK